MNQILTLLIWLVAVPTVLFLAMLLVNGAMDFYMAWRLARNHGTDRTAAILNWNAFKWSWLSQLDAIVKVMPFMGKDLTEIFGIRHDDGRVT